MSEHASVVAKNVGNAGATSHSLPAVLLVDDQPARLLTYEAILDGVGVQCVRAHSGKEALEKLLNQTFAVILLDVSMPDMDGFETARLIRAHPRFERTPIIFVTGVHISEIDTLKGYEVGAIDYIAVPIVPEILRSKVALLVELYQRRTQLESLNRDLEKARIDQHDETVTRLLAEARAEKEWLSALLDSMNEEVYFTDTNGRYKYANPAAHREFQHVSVEGQSVTELVAPLEVYRADGTPRPIEEAPPLRALAGEVIKDEEQIVRTPRTGELRRRQVSSAPVRDSLGQIIGSVSVVRDVTEQRRVEASLREADERKDIFLATLSHELRNPLAPIRTAAKLLESPDLTHELLDRCRNIISRQVTFMSALLNDLLDVSRLTRGQLTLKRSVVPLRQIVDDALESARPLMTEKQQHFEIDVQPPEVIVEVDAVRVTQILSNLLTNAAKYTPAEGAITLTARISADDSLAISVKDSGVGITKEMMPKVFEMFARSPSPEAQTNGGLGIGLALAQALAQLHGGRIEAYSDGLNCGSTFKVSLAACVVRKADDARAGRAEALQHKSAPKRVLIADDNKDAADSLAVLVELSGHEVHVAYNGTDALDLAERTKPEIALLDIGMPGLSGYELARALREKQWGVGMTLVAVTGWGQERDRSASRAAGFDMHLTKPIDPERLDAIFESATPVLPS